MAGPSAIPDPLTARFRRPSTSDLSRRFFFLVDAIARHQEPTATQLERLASSCSGQLIPDTALSFSSATAGASPSLN